MSDVTEEKLCQSASQERPSPHWSLEERPTWTADVTARDLHKLRVHRWFFFPHSFAPALVANLTAEWNLPKGAVIADPYCGAGTTLVAAQQLGLSVIGWDLSPLAVFASRVKLAHLDGSALCGAWAEIAVSARRQQDGLGLEACEELVRRAIPDDSLSVLLRLWSTIAEMQRRVDAQPNEAKGSALHWDALRLAILAELPSFSRLTRKGGWLAKTEPAANVSQVFDRVAARVRMMAVDLADVAPSACREFPAQIDLADARALPSHSASVDAIITSPPYPNRHDYTRMFGIELAFGFLDDQGIRQLRHQSVSSHPEARPNRPDQDGYAEPAALTMMINEIAARIDDGHKRRMSLMLSGYFLDMWFSLREAHRILRSGGYAAYVVGNARYKGVAIEVDTLVGELAENIGFAVDHVYVARRRGNSAQQMKNYGRQPQRESVVVLRRL
jgi:tRNA G10  N-methylase Trm11